jgi:hypothetical protein
MLKRLRKGVFYVGMYVALAVFAIQPNPATAYGIGFGGRVIMAYYCPCSANIMLYILTPWGYVLPIVYQPGLSILKAKYRPIPGAAVLGTYVPGGVCLSLYYCVPYGLPIGTVFIMGTS